jgi:hypothetical protein
MHLTWATGGRTVVRDVAGVDVVCVWYRRGRPNKPSVLVEETRRGGVTVARESVVLFFGVARVVETGGGGEGGVERTAEWWDKLVGIVAVVLQEARDLFIQDGQAWSDLPDQGEEANDNHQSTCPASRCQRGGEGWR